ncbi:MAG: glutamate synthase-related protein [Planctomycetota bacterium]|jgi:glutamate synthase domain-containing protein 2
MDFRWRCPVCGYIHDGPTSPEFAVCPVCATPAEEFVKENRPEEHFGNWTHQARAQIEAMARTGNYPVHAKGTTRRFLHFDSLMVVPSFIAHPPLLDDEPVDIGVTIGPNAKQPLRIGLPVMISGMSLGALSPEAKVALAKGSALAGTATNSGEGGFYPPERDAADRFVFQYSTGRFGVTEENLKAADAIEIKLSQGAKPGMGGLLPGAKVSPLIAALRGVEPGTTVHSPSRHKDIGSPKELAERIAELKQLTGGRPVGIKMAAGKIERDLGALFDAGGEPDYVVIDGAEGGTGASPIFTKDHIALPLIHGLPKAARFLEGSGMRDKLSLVATGGLRTPMDFVKALCLGADAVYSAGAMKMALGCTYLRRCHIGDCPYGIATMDESLRKRLDIEARARDVANLLQACGKTIESACRILGHAKVGDLALDDLAALNPEAARVTGAELA